jgi:hypothetical protein
VGDSFIAVSIIGDYGFAEYGIMGDSFIAVSIIGDSGFAEYDIMGDSGFAFLPLYTKFRYTRGSHPVKGQVKKLRDSKVRFNNYILNGHKVGLYSTRFLIDQVRVLLHNKFLY